VTVCPSLRYPVTSVWCLQLWKRSGAWFFGDIPPHSTPPPNDHSHHGDRSTRPLTPSPSPIPVRRNAQPVLAEPDRHSVASYEDRIQTYRPGIKLHRTVITALCCMDAGMACVINLV